MSRPSPDIVDALARLRVLVLGDAMLDVYLEGTSDRLCPEAPVPVVALAGRREAPGGAANAAANAAALGARVRFLSAVGADADGVALRRALKARGVDTEHLLKVSGRRTLAKQRVRAAGQLLLRLDTGDTGPVAAPVEDELLGRLQALWWWCDVAIVSDYGYGPLSSRVIAALAVAQERSPRTLVVDSKRLGAYRAAGPTAVKPNYAEARRLLGLKGPGGRPRAAAMAGRGDALLAATGARVAALTLDAEGALVFERGRPAHRTTARPHPQSRAAGAGDTFTAVLALALAAGSDTPAAAEVAAAAAAVVVSKDGTACCSAGELRDALAAGCKTSDAASLAVRLEAYRREGKRVALTNGCFDILHRGHVTYLNQARELGDVLVVGVNTDDSIRRLKGPGRPINTLDDRLQVLAALGCVDHVVAFHEDTPHRLIRAVRPDVFVKGGDYTRDRLPEASLVEELGGVVRILPLVSDRSTSGVIERIQAGAATPPVATLAPLAAASQNGSAKV
jgi:D-beta-D-heptose 7-phosphate kinase/D-beta-D-heptose 1-phosphate adenosyltransferase